MRCGIVSVGRPSSNSRRASAIARPTSRTLPPGSGVAAVRHGTGACCSFVSSVSVTRSATARAVVYFAPATLRMPFDAVARRDRGPARGPASATRSPWTDAGTTPRCTSVTSASVKSSAGNAWLSSAMKAATSRSSIVGVVRIADAVRLPGAEQRALAPRHEEEIAAGGRSAAERLVAGVAPGDQVHRLQHRDAGRGAERRQQPIDAGAGRVHGDARGNLERARRRARRAR